MYEKFLMPGYLDQNSAATSFVAIERSTNISALFYAYVILEEAFFSESYI